MENEKKFSKVLEPYEEICPECKGYGKVIIEANCNGGSHTEVSGYCPRRDC